ncbi:MAG: hypothetical protein JWQ02_3629 [Capsulimonas sp.]|jgi:hypothetical protein|nr:hypothetical protein [Capsulimonas sp.]
MTPMSSKICLGDLVRALGALSPGDQPEANVIARQLGFTPQSASVRSSDGPTGKVDFKKPPSKPDFVDPPIGLHPPSITDDISIIPLSVTTMEAAHITDPPITAEPIAPIDPEEARRRPPLDPLFSRNWLTGILVLSLSKLSKDGPIDVEALTPKLACGEPITSLPRRRTPTLRHGVQILVDHGEVMEPFARDQDQLCLSIARIVGADRTEQIPFRYLPDRNLGPFGEMTEFRWPAPGCAILLLSDLGLLSGMNSTDGAAPSEWGEFADRAARHGCRVIAYAPVSPQRIPNWMRKKITVIPWDTKTTAGIVRSIRGAA